MQSLPSDDANAPARAITWMFAALNTVEQTPKQGGHVIRFASCVSRR
jgi:hypothetical protein